MSGRVMLMALLLAFTAQTLAQETKNISTKQMARLPKGNVSLGLNRSVATSHDSQSALLRGTANLSAQAGVKGLSYTSICQAYQAADGRTARWTDKDGQRRSMEYAVGSRDCIGRCGPGCFGSPVYTQECLNHDACVENEGEQFGACADEWLAAAYGFVFAPKC
ncbi:unnamed protein product [Symbiodinium sp. CCMP2456]|nr:unnamed protein product [Symbiodinium sp. CCMP2456]